jgi:ribosomal protein L11 methylase PrmA
VVQDVALLLLNVVLVLCNAGEHPTTRLCLQQLMEWGQPRQQKQITEQQQQQQNVEQQQNAEQQEQQQQSLGLKGWRVMDYGAGSGVLAITGTSAFI